MRGAICPRDGYPVGRKNPWKPWPALVVRSCDSWTGSPRARACLAAMGVQELHKRLLRDRYW